MASTVQSCARETGGAYATAKNFIPNPLKVFQFQVVDRKPPVGIVRFTQAGDDGYFRAGSSVQGR